MIFDEQAIEAAVKHIITCGCIDDERAAVKSALQAAIESLKERGFSIVKDGYKFVHGPNCPCTDCT